MVTIDFLTRSFALTDALFIDVIGQQALANRYMEQGNLAEFSGYADPESFYQAYRYLEASLAPMDKALGIYDELLGVLEQQPTLPEFGDTMAKLLQEEHGLERINDRLAARYSDVGTTRTAEEAGAQFSDLASLMAAQRGDLQTLRGLTVEALEAYKGVLPLAERGEFVARMLSGRSPFSEKYDELVDARSTFSTFYTRACMVSIRAVMQIAPTGLEFVKGEKPKLPPRSEPIEPIAAVRKDLFTSLRHLIDALERLESGASGASDAPGGMNSPQDVPVPAPTAIP